MTTLQQDSVNGEARLADASHLPSEAVYLPFEGGPYRMAMGLTTVAEREWFVLDERYLPEMAEKHRLIAERHDEVFGALPISNAARAEVLAAVVANVTTCFPQWFACDGDTLHNRLTGESWDLAAPACDPLELAGLLVQDDLCIIQDGMFTAASLCFPSRWRLHDKLGKPLVDVHQPVPYYAERLATPVDRFMAKVKPGHIASRLNWSVTDSDALFQPGGKWRVVEEGRVTAENAGTMLNLRVERQTLRRMPESDAILFGIRVHSYPLAKAITQPKDAARLAEAVRALPEETVNYKSLKAYGAALLGWLDAHSH